LLPIISGASKDRDAIETSVNIYHSTRGKVIEGFKFQNAACIFFLAMLAITNFLIFFSPVIGKIRVLIAQY
jgi:hypothetical protein